MQKLRRLQNCAARLACKVNRFDKVRSEDLFKKLHWLKVRERVVYKVLLTVHKCVYGDAPPDLKDMINLSQSNRTKKVEVKDCNGGMGDQAFSVCGPRLWNALPTRLRLLDDVKDFKAQIKTYLFTNGDLSYEIVHRK